MSRIVEIHNIVVFRKSGFDSDLCRYMATIEAITPAGYIVIYDEWGNKEEVGGQACVGVLSAVFEVIMISQLLQKLPNTKDVLWMFEMGVVQVDVSNVRELNITDNDADALDQMLDAAGGVIHPDADADIMVDAEREAEVTRLAIKQKIAQAADVDAISRDLPPKLRIKPDDSEDVVSLISPGPSIA